jgi:hypothetical protein
VPDPRIVARRLHASGLDAPRFATPEAVVGWFGAVQSQDVPGSSWGVGQRLAGSPPIATFDEALDGGRFLRIHTMRPTWHYVLAEDIRWLLQLTSPRVQRLAGSYYRKRELDGATLTRSAKVIAAELEGGRHRTKAELSAALARAGQPTADLADGFSIMYAEFEGLICSGPRRGRTHTYALLEERVPPAPARSREEALAELSRRYFQSHGPAQPRDFAWWSGLTIADAKAGLALLGGDVVRETIDGADWWWVAPADGRDPVAPPAPAPASPTVHLLPNFDEYLVSYRDREVAFDHTLLGGRDLLEVFYAHVVTVDGMLVGGWKRLSGPGEVVVRLDLLRELSVTEREALEAAAAAFGAFVGMPVRLEG